MGDQGRGWGRPCPECRVRGCAVAALGEGARLEPPDGSGRGPRKWRRPLVGTAQSSGAAPSLWRPPGAVGQRRRRQVGRQGDGPGRRDVKRWCRVGGRPVLWGAAATSKEGVGPLRPAKRGKEGDTWGWGAPRAELAAAASPVPTPYYGWGGYGPPAHLELVALAILADLLSWEVLHVVPGVLSGSIPEPSYLEHESLLVVIPLSDKVVEDSLIRFTYR